MREEAFEYKMVGGDSAVNQGRDKGRWSGQAFRRNACPHAFPDQKVARITNPRGACIADQCNNCTALQAFDNPFHRTVFVELMMRLQWLVNPVMP